MSKKTETAKTPSAEDVLRLVEELVWVLSAKDTRHLRYGLAELRNALMHSKSDSARLTPLDKNRDSHLLIGVLPQLLADADLFPANQDIEKFANEIFHIVISRWEKRSRYEMIGMLVMEVQKLENSELAELVLALSELISREGALDKIKKASKLSGFSWNTTIRNLKDL